ncbi:MAG: HAD hydrolase-like protein [Clostridia bacterium]|nr:HAD hydrolase-like protein [Clostridia bacterium]
MHPSHFLIGIDSDGTAFDSMNIKHLDAFIPAALEIWPMDQSTAEAFIRIEKTVNLFSSLRGINRYPGLLEVFDRLKKECPDAAGLPDLTALRAYLAGESRYSPVTLKAWLSAHPSGELEKVLAWSDRADTLFARACDGLQPFPGVRESLAEACKTATVAVVSSAARVGLEKDWAAGGLTPCVDLLMSQDDGSKTAQLQKAMATCHSPVTALMLGDTDSDGQCAHEAGALFYPIMPGDEAASWQRFRKEILPLFLAGKYDAIQEKKYYDQLKAMLG